MKTLWRWRAIRALAVLGIGLVIAALAPCAPAADAPAGPLTDGAFAWELSAPLIAPAPRPADPCHSIKDPSVVFFDSRWHLGLLKPVTPASR